MSGHRGFLKAANPVFPERGLEKHLAKKLHNKVENLGGVSAPDRRDVPPARPRRACFAVISLANRPPGGSLCLVSARFEPGWRFSA
jgi:hypothetical protein